MEATSKKAANSVLRIVVAIGLLTGLIVVPIATASATAPNNGAPVDNLNPRTAAGTTGWNTPAVLANDVQTCSSLNSTDFPTGTDLYHFVVTSESKTTVERVIPDQTRTWTDNRGTFSKTGTLTVTYTFDRSANFMKNNPPLGSVRVKYASEDPDTDWVESPTRPGAEETLPWTSFNYKNVSPNHIYVAVPKGNTLVDAKLNYDIDINNLRKTEKLEWTETSRNNTRTESQTFPIQGNGTLQIAVDDTNYLSTQSAYTQNLTSSHNLSHTCANPASPTITLSSATAGYTVTYTKSHAWTITKDFVTINEETPQESYFDKGIAPRFTIDITRNEAEIDAASYELATATVTGTFSLEAASLNDASVKLAVADVSDITCNTEDDNNTNDNLYKYSCTWNPTLKPTGKNALQDYSWTVSGTVTGGSSTPSTREGKYGLNSGETQRDSNLNATVDFSDDLANLAAQRDELERIERVLVAGGGTADDESDDVYAWDIDCDGPACTIGDAEFKRGLVAGGGTAEDESDDVYAWEIDCNDVACTVDDRNTDTTNDDQLVVYNGWTLESLDCGSLTCVVSKDKLTASAISGNATITYTSPWNWKQYTDATTCTKGWTNTATLTAGNGSVAYSWDTNCPPPTVTINSDIESSYKVTYDNVYDWVVTKTFDGQDRGGTNRQATLVANYTVTASRNPNPTVENRQGSALTVTGTFETTFASYDNVEVTVDLIGGDSGTPIYTRVGSCDEEAASATLTRDNGKFTCTIPASDLPLIETNDGWDAEDLRITASVTTAGGKDDDVTTHGIGKPDESTGSNVHDTAKIVDDGGGYKAINVSCTTIPSETNCLIDADGIITSGVIETSESNETITLTYSLDWLAVADPSAACPSIANKADVMGDVIMGEPVLLDTGTSTEPMTCPTLTFEITQTPAHGIKYDDTYTWTVVKTADGSDVDTWKPKYKVVVTRNASTETGHQIIDASQQVTGQVTLKTQVEQVNSSGTWIDVNPTSFQPTKGKIAGLALTLSTGPTTCTFSEESFEDTDGKFAFTCLVEVESVVTTRNGLDGTEYNLTAAGNLFDVPARNGSFENNAWGMPFRPLGSAGGKTVDATATLSDNTATLGIYGTATGITGGIDNNKIWSARNLPNTDNPGVKPSSDSLDLTWTLRYTLDWKIDVTGCDKEFTNTASLTRSDTTEALTDSETGKVTCPNAIPAFTIGYYGNKAGGTQVWKNKEQWRTNKPVWAPAWHNALGTGHKLDYGLPDFRDDSAVRTYMTNANCNSGGANSGGKTCQTMFRAQALASVNNAIRNGAPLQGYMVSGGTIGRQFANQGVLFRDPADAKAKCWKVHNILAELEFVGPSSVDGGTTAALIDRRIAYKTIFDDLNNARAKRCPLVP